MDDGPGIVAGNGRAVLAAGRWLVTADRAQLGPLVSAAGEDGRPVRWVVADPTADDVAAATAAGLTPRRDVHQLRRPLPVEPHVQDAYPSLEVRPLRPGTADEATWVACNNRAFADHPDQAGYTLERLHAVMAERWFDPAGFLLHEEAGRLAGFCWTKVHDDNVPPLGEIFVIGVDPDFAGRRYGPALSLAGLASLAARGLRVAMLYVDETNVAARHMYARLGFTAHHVDRVFESTT